MHEKKRRDNSSDDLPGWYKPAWLADVLKSSYGPQEKKQLKLMIPISSILNFFKRRK